MSLIEAEKGRLFMVGAIPEGSTTFRSANAAQRATYLRGLGYAIENAFGHHVGIDSKFPQLPLANLTTADISRALGRLSGSSKKSAPEKRSLHLAIAQPEPVSARSSRAILLDLVGALARQAAAVDDASENRLMGAQP